MSSFPAIADAAASSDAPPPGASLAPDRGDAGPAGHPLPATQPVQSTTLDRTPREMRLTGWTPQVKCGFLEALARCGNVRDAAAFVSMSREGAYKLRRRDRAFALAWEGALVQARKLAEDRGNNIVTLSAEETQVWRDASEPIYEAWIADMNSKGIDGQALIDEARALMDAYDG